MLAHVRWQEREPVVALWLWQCVVGAVLLSFGLALVFGAASLSAPIRARLFDPAPVGVQESYGLSAAGVEGVVGGLVAVLALAGLYLMGHLIREVRIARTSRQHRYRALREAAPLMPMERVGRERLVVLESARPEAWSLPLPMLRPLQLVVSTAAMRQLSADQLDAVLEHERNHARARHHLLLQGSGALASAFPRVRLFTAFAERAGRLVEMAADDVAARRHGRMATALALVDLNAMRGGLFGGGAGRGTDEGAWSPGAPLPAPVGEVAVRVDRLLVGLPRLQPGERLHVTAVAALIAATPVLLAFAPGLAALAA
jgi:hypothetical protein